MHSNSLRISAELFTLAREEADLLSRSTAQQIEHWAKIGRAVEAAGLTVHAAKELVRRNGKLDIVHVQNEKELWDHKRELQVRDIQLVESGRATAESMSWFTETQARRAKIKDAPY